MNLIKISSFEGKPKFAVVAYYLLRNYYDFITVNFNFSPLKKTLSSYFPDFMTQ